MTQPEIEDPILQSRARIRMATRVGKRLGYGCFMGAVIIFLINYYLEGSGFWTSLTVSLLVIGSLILAPSIIFAYAANAADREDQGLPHGH